MKDNSFRKQQLENLVNAEFNNMRRAFYSTVRSLVFPVLSAAASFPIVYSIAFCSEKERPIYALVGSLAVFSIGFFKNFHPFFENSIAFANAYERRKNYDKELKDILRE